MGKGRKEYFLIGVEGVVIAAHPALRGLGVPLAIAPA